MTSSAISYSLPNTTVDRLNIGESAKNFVTYEFGFDVANFQYTYFISNNQRIVYSTSGSVDNVILRLPITVPFYDNVGSYYLNLELLKNNIIQYSKLLPITVYDNVVTNVIFNNQLTDNQLTIPFQVTTFIEDTLVNIPANVGMFNAKTNESLKNITVVGTQYFSITLPNVSSIPQVLKVVTTISNSLYKGSVKYYPVYYRNSTTLATNYDQSISVERLEQLTLQTNVTEIKSNDSVTSGSVSMGIDSSPVKTINLTNTNTISYVIPVSLTVGKHSLTLNYSGTDSLRPCTRSYNLYVYANVHFTDVTVNNTFTNPTTPILVSGYVKDENETGIITKVAIVDTNNTIIDQTITTSLGKFSFIIQNTDIMGYYNYKLEAETVNYYKSADYQFDLLQNNAFSVQIVTNKTMALSPIKIKGDIYGEYQLSYFTANTKNYNLSLLTLNDAGEIQTYFLTPNVLGTIYFNVTNIKDPSQTWVQKFVLYKTPTVSITQLNAAYVGERVNLTIDSDVSYRLSFNNKLVTNQNYFINKSLISIPMDTKGINILKVVFSSEYITIPEVNQEIFVYDHLKLHQNIPAKINENTNITVYLQVVNYEEVPVGNVEIQFRYKDTVIFTEQTDNKGYLQTYIIINDNLENYNFRIVSNKEQYINQQDFSVDSVLIRTLTVTSNIKTLKFNDLTGTVVSFTVFYKNTGQPAPLVNMTIEIINDKQEKDTLHVMTSNTGLVTIQIEKPVGTYILTIITTNPNYNMAKVVYSFKVEGFNVVNNPFILPALMLSSVGIIIIGKKKALK